MRAALIYNPKSGRHASARLQEEVVELLRSGGFDVEPRPTRGPGDATVLAQEAAESGIDVAFGMGGDGTLREVAAGLLGTETALGLLPAGTANVLAISLDVPGAALGAALAYSRGSKIREIDVGRAGEEIFLMMVSGGLDARIMARANPERKKRYGKLEIVATGVSQWFRGEEREAEIRVDGETLRGSFYAICNIPHYGGSFRMTPADPADGELDLIVFHGRGRWAFASFAAGVVLGGRHMRRSDVSLRRVREVEIVETPEIQIDGDFRPSEQPFRVELAGRLRVLVPGTVLERDR